MQERRLASGTSVDWQGRRLTDFDLDEQKERQRMPEPMPSAWLSPVKPAPPSTFLRHLGGVLMGLTVGLAIAVPGVLWHKGRIDPLAMIGMATSELGIAVAAPVAATVKVAAPVAEAPPRVARVPVEVARDATPVIAPPSTPTKVATAPEPISRATPTASTMVVLQPAPVEVAPAKPELPRSEVLLNDARRLIGEGDLPAARQKLEDQALTTNAAARFLLAETFDPNFLAARGIRSVRAEVPRAIELYREALDGGMDAARQRLSALRP
jgi:hypothetical protein